MAVLSWAMATSGRFETMARYFYDIADGEKQPRDGDGLDLSGPWDARNMALAVLPHIARDAILARDAAQETTDAR